MNNKEFKKLEKKFNEAIELFAQDVAMQIEGAYENIIDEFYAEYDPRWYDRTYSTYLGSSGYYGLFNNWENGNGYRAGIEVDSSNIPGDPYRADKDWVFARTFEKGIHGYGLMDRRKYGFKKSDWVDSYRKKKSYKRYSKMRKTQKIINGKMTHGLQIGFDRSVGEYKPLISATGRYVKNSQSPKKQMNRRFRQITKKSNMNALSSKYINKALGL